MGTPDHNNGCLWRSPLSSHTMARVPTGRQFVNNTPISDTRHIKSQTRRNPNATAPTAPQHHPHHQSGTVSLAPKDIDIAAAIRSLAETANESVGPILELPPNGDLHALADEVRVRQILRNLLSNARRYGGDTIVSGADGRTRGCGSRWAMTVPAYPPQNASAFSSHIQPPIPSRGDCRGWIGSDRVQAVGPPDVR